MSNNVENTSKIELLCMLLPTCQQKTLHKNICVLIYLRGKNNEYKPKIVGLSKRV